MLPVGLIGFILRMELEGGFYAEPPKNKLDRPILVGRECIMYAAAGFNL
jgi:hypothetical protein